MSPIAVNSLVGGRYRVVRFIARGGMGAVYEVEHVHTSERLALKLIIATGPLEGEALVRFKRESAAAARIKSEHVVRVTDAGIDDALGGVAFLAMDLLEGADLESAAGAIPQKPDVVVEWLRQVAEGLHRAHALGLVHRDLKPQNLFLTTRPDGTPLVKILDFGIVKHDNLDVSPTVSGAVLGTPMYMAPEQAGFGSAEITLRADLYAMGLITYRLLAGANYRRGETVAKLLGEMTTPALPPPSERGLALGPAFDAWFSKACAWDQAKRFTSAREQSAALTEALRGAKTADRASMTSAQLNSFVSAPTAMMTTPPIRTTKRRRWSTSLTIGVALTALITGFIWVRPTHVASTGPAIEASTDAAVELRPMQLTDYPDPKTDSAEALKEYRNSWRDSYDAVRPPQVALERAIALDPTFAAAQLRHAFYTSRPSSVRSYQQAVRYRDKLDARDASLLQAYAPCELPEQPDFDECVRQLDQIHRENPADLEVLRLVGSLQRRSHPGTGVAAFEELGRLDPKMASAEYYLAGSAMDRGADEEAALHLDRCIARSSSAGLCILKQGDLASRGGHCEKLAQGVRRVMVFDAQNEFVRLYGLSASLTTDAPRLVVDQGVASLLQLTSGDASYEPRYRGEVALWFGDLRRAYEQLGRSDALEQARDNSVLWAGTSRLVAAEELGDEALLTDLLRAYFAARVPRTDQGDEELFLRAMRQHHVVSEKEFANLRVRWAEARRADQSVTAWQRWLSFEGMLAQSAEEARAALADPASAPVPKSAAIEERAELGRLLLMAGRPRDAIPYLEDAASFCQVFNNFYRGSRTSSIMRSAFYLGEAHESLGERDEACAAYSPLLRRWGVANPPRPVTAEKARQRAVALGCP